MAHIWQLLSQHWPSSIMKSGWQKPWKPLPPSCRKPTNTALHPASESQHPALHFRATDSDLFPEGKPDLPLPHRPLPLGCLSMRYKSQLPAELPRGALDHRQVQLCSMTRGSHTSFRCLFNNYFMGQQCFEDGERMGSGHGS